MGLILSGCDRETSGLAADSGTISVKRTKTSILNDCMKG
jgi:hypothetical protein